jgi:hypothetical protein
MLAMLAMTPALFFIRNEASLPYAPRARTKSDSLAILQ